MKWTFNYKELQKERVPHRSIRFHTWTTKTLSDANRLMELVIEIVSLPDPITSNGPSLRMNDH